MWRSPKLVWMPESSKPSGHYGYTEHALDTASDLAAALLPLGQKVKPWSGSVIYRGVGDSRHRLLPGALRRTGRELVSALTNRDASSDTAICVEFLQLQWFVTACDQGGLRIPGDSPAFRRTIATAPDAAIAGRRPWPFNEHLEVWAAAQHHGLLTRLLDWTRLPVPAIYFAAANALTDDQSDRLAVWVLETERLDPFLRNGEGLQVVALPGATSPNLAAQHGLFTVVLERIRRGAQWPEKTVEDVFASVANAEPPLHKVTAPRRVAVELLEICETLGVGGGTLFPGMDGAAREARDRAWRYRRDSPTG